MHGPLDSPAGLTPTGLRQQSQSESGLPLRGLNPALVMSGLRNPRAYEAAKAAALIAVHDAALAVHDRPGGSETLSAHREAFTQEVRTWLRDRDASDPRLRAVLDSMVRREDRGLVERLQRHFGAVGTSVDQALPVWRDLAELSKLSEKEALAEQVTSSDQRPQSVTREIDDDLRAPMARRTVENPTPAAGAVAAHPQRTPERRHPRPPLAPPSSRAGSPPRLRTSAHPPRSSSKRLRNSAHRPSPTPPASPRPAPAPRNPVRALPRNAPHSRRRPPQNADIEDAPCSRGSPRCRNRTFLEPARPASDQQDAGSAMLGSSSTMEG